MTTGLPYQLDEGILLEDGTVLLDWNSSGDVLLQVSQPATEELPGERLDLLWRNRRWLGGMDAALYTALKKNEHLRRVGLTQNLNGRSDRLGFVISYHVPEPHASKDQGAGDQSFERHLDRLGLTFGRWHELKNYLLDLQFGGASPPPAALLDHPIVRLALRSRETRDGALLDQAAAKLTGSAKQAWLVLDKS
jgi:hypothetical protein